MSLSEKLIKSAKAGNSREVRKLLGRGVQITKDKFGNTALHEAAWNGHSDIVKALLSAFCFVDGINNSGFTPLHLASQNGHGKAVKTLLKWKTDSSLQNEHGETALHLAAKYNHATVISVFASFKVNLDIRGKVCRTYPKPEDSNTALHIAAKLGNNEALKALLRGGASPHIMNARGARPVEYAEIRGFKSAIKLLNSKGKMRARSTTESKPKSKTPTVEVADKEASSMASAGQTSALRLHRANSAAARINFRLVPKKQNSLPADLTSALQDSYSPSPTNPYEDMDNLDAEQNSVEITPKATPTIDQMLTEIEQEYLGPDYKYCPPVKGNPPVRGGPPYEKAWEGGTHGTAAVRNSERQSQAKSPMGARRNASLERYDSQRRVSFDSSGDYLPPEEMRAIQNVLQRTFQAYETIPPKSLSSDEDSYVYMAPCRDVQSGSPQPSPSNQENYTPNTEQKFKIPKRAIICSSPVVAGQRHEPNVALTPAKGILSQPSSLQQSELDRYLQAELETMRQAFQIRLAQLEKRYQRQLMMEQQRNSTGAAMMAVPINVQLRAQQRRGSSYKRRSSWHSCLSDSDTDEPAPDLIQRSGSSQGFDSDCSMEESDVEMTPAGQSDERAVSHDLCHGRAMGGGTTTAGGSGVPQLRDRASSLGSNPRHVGGGLKGGGRMWNVEPGNGARAGPRLSPVQDAIAEEDGSLSPGAKALVRDRVSEHRAKILHYFQQVSEAKIAVIEQQYEAQMSEVEHRYQSRATEKLSRLETRVKDLEKMLDVQTLV